MRLKHRFLISKLRHHHLLVMVMVKIVVNTAMLVT